MADYDAQQLEQKWRRYWEEKAIFRTPNNSDKPKCYVLDMFPYPSGSGLHVGHPLGYIASDVLARYYRQLGYNVLHPMGFDSFGLPAEQYAIQTGQHPADTTEENIRTYTAQLKNLGLSYDWERQVRTSEPSYYRWTQWIFLQLFHSYYDREKDQARPISELVARLEKAGNHQVAAAHSEDLPLFSAEDWQGFSEKEQEAILHYYRLAYLADTTVNWCPALGTVLANDEVKDGYSERGGHPVEQKKMQQWCLRITAYAERLLQDLQSLDWSEAIKEMQRNWIGKSVGAELFFPIQGREEQIKVFTTRVDTAFGVTYMALAPEHELVESLSTPEQKAEVEAYVRQAKNRSELERISDTKGISGVFTGAYAQNPFNGEAIPIWVADYVLIGYGSGAVMAVPSGDERDFRFARHFNLPIWPVFEGHPATEEAYSGKEGRLINSGFLDGMEIPEAIEAAARYAEEQGFGRKRTMYRIRDAIFSRQRYWGEPFPIYYENGIPRALSEDQLPLRLPEVDSFQPTEDGEPPLARAEAWGNSEGHPYEKNTMPGWAGSSWYFLRYMDPHNQQAFASRQATDYWNQVDVYIGGTEHAVGHLMYSRFWCKFLYDRGHIGFQEPFKRLINQGMIQGRSNFVYRVKGENTFVSKGLKDQYETAPMHVDVNLVHNDELDLEAFRRWRPDLIDAEFVLEDGKYYCGHAVEKMSKRCHNVVNPDRVVEQDGADSLRIYEMFLGPLEDSKPWDTNGLEGVKKFLRKTYRLFFNEQGRLAVTDEAPTDQEQKIIHTLLKKIPEELGRFSFNTCVPAYMVCVNELASAKCRKREVLEKLVLALSPYAPHLCEELWEALGHSGSIAYEPFPPYEEKYLVEASHTYPISINGKVRAKIPFPVDKPKEEIEKEVLAAEDIQKWVAGKNVQRVIVVPQKIVNLVVK